MATTNGHRWWRDAVIYQVYPRSFADGDGDGVGDIAGIRSRLPYLAGLGIDAIWFNPWYPSPMADAGYDVIDYRDIEPVFGTLAEAEALIAEAHDLDVRIIIDIVPNHGSDAMPWFQQALADGPGSEMRQRYWFRPGRGSDGGEPPNDWQSIFGGSAWTRTKNPDGTPGEWYLHLFAPEQPDLNWDHPAIREEFLDVLRFWLDRGVDGIRIDSAALLVKDPALPDGGDDADPLFTDRDEVHEIYRSWRALADTYDGDRLLVGEVWLPDPVRFANYLRPDELHTAFNFGFLGCPWNAAALRTVIDDTIRYHEPVGAPATWVLSNHDVTRHVTRYGRADTSFSFAAKKNGAGEIPVDLALGERRARAALLLCLALPGSSYLYQGEELGLWEVEDIPEELRDDPMWHRSNHTDPGRDGCRVPIPWSGGEAPFGFGPQGTTPWLPQPAAWGERTVEAQSGDPASMLSLYQAALGRRREETVLGHGPMTWLDAREGVLAFTREDALTCVVNLSAEPLALPEGHEVLLASGDLEGDALPTDSAVWLRGRAELE
ncbi:glycoside hydrolase family 13 protein [Phytomonospora sp. NPDC050363]|uniref:glycoside hydrolase family 13 protein n=1 Tax=Phytomonospora sp. NPDC050363 TaxID=3155642 RepID=UPI0033C8358A